MSANRNAEEAILEAAIHEFAERGYEGVRLEHVARRAGCNRTLIYRYFGDREGFFQEALRAQFTKRTELSVVILLAIMPQVVLLVTGEEAGSDGFRERWSRFLKQFAEALGPRGGAGK